MAVRGLLTFIAAGALWTSAAAGEVVVAERVIRAGTIVGPEDLGLREGSHPGSVSDIGDAIGLEARAIIHAGRPVMWSDLGAPTAVDRNDLVLIVFHRGGLTITSEGRSLGRGGVGDRVQVMNTSSRQTVVATVTGDGTVLAGGSDAVER